MAQAYGRVKESGGRDCLSQPPLHIALPRRALPATPCPVELPNEPEHQYSWVEVGKKYLDKPLGLNQAALERNARMRALVEEHERTGQPFLLDTNLFCVRKITDWTRRLARDRELGKTREFFLLMRNPLEGRDITGDYLERVSEGRDGRDRPAIEFVLNKEGGERFYEVTSKNKPSSDEEGFRRQMAVIFDGQVHSAPTLISPIRTGGQITGEFTQSGDRPHRPRPPGGALPVRLLSEPVRESCVAPGK
jgi:hypothetical protein